MFCHTVSQMGLGDAVREAREARGWSQNELARRVELDQSTLSKIEKGTRVPSVLIVARIAGALAVSIDHLMRDVTLPSVVHPQSLEERVDQLEIDLAETARIADDAQALVRELRAELGLPEKRANEG